MREDLGLLEVHAAVDVEPVEQVDHLERARPAHVVAQLGPLLGLLLRFFLSAVISSTLPCSSWNTRCCDSRSSWFSRCARL
jgi:hypothetical protein